MKFNDRYITLVAIVFSLIIAFIFFGQNLHAQMGAIDDNFYLSRNVLKDPINAYENFIEAPELISFGKSSRFRIIFWVIQDTQTVLWGMNASYWYLINILVFAFFIFTIFYISWKNLNIKWALPITLFMLGQIYFAYIFTRLGTAETWTMFGVSVYMLGYASIFRKIKNKNNKSNWMEWFAMFIGVLISVGSKENFSVMLVAIISLLVILKHYKAITKSAIIMSILMIIINLYQIAYVFTMQINKGVDLYQNDLSVLYRLMQLVQSVSEGQILFFGILALLFFISLIIFRFYFWKKKININATKKEIYDKLLFNPFIFFVVINIFFAFNVYVYDGKFYIAHRYAFPYVFLIQLLVILIIYWFLNIKKIYFSQCCLKYFKFVYMILIIILLIPIYNSFKKAQSLSEKNVEVTTTFQKKLNEVIKQVKNSPEKPIIFYSHKPYDFEPMYATATYLQYYNVNNEIMAVVLDDPNKETRHFLLHLIDVKKGWEKEGGYHNNLFVPYSNPDECFSVDFSETTTDTKCRNLGKIWN